MKQQKSQYNSRSLSGQYSVSGNKGKVVWIKALQLMFPMESLGVTVKRSRLMFRHFAIFLYQAGEQSKMWLNTSVSIQASCIG
uniref:Uncharacterized protein n=1 Tax=Arundo donax TaxID=35708 RepID=A0A0A9C558_ARUDO